MASTILQRTLGTPTNRKKFTTSMWLKKCFNGSEKHFFGMGTSGGYLDFRFASTGELELYHYNSGYQFRLTTTRKFRDTNAWYHLVFTIDTTLATADDRFKVYVNGVQETVFTNRTNPSQDYDIPANVSGNTISVGNYGTNTSNSFDGLISHVHFSDGYTYDPTPFGETDATTGEWKIKTSVSGVTYGTNGFWWLKDTIATTDHSSNSNTFSVVSGTLTQTADCPSNVFATLNPLIVPTSNAPTFSFGNTKVATMNADPGHFGGASTLGASSGKWYFEVKLSATTSTNAFFIGVSYDPFEMARQGTTASAQYAAPTYLYYGYNGNKFNNGSNSSYGNSYTVGDIIGVALDLDNHKLYFHKNGTYQNSGVPTSGSTGTGSAFDLTTGETYFLVLSDGGGAVCTFECNFGNGYFGTTAVSSAGTNASNNGIFEYDVPTGYTALSTKGLNE